MLQLVNGAADGVYHDTVEVCAEPAAPHHKHIQEIFDEVSHHNTTHPNHRTYLLIVMNVRH